MDDSCVVCADTLEWVAYGPCGHREVCSTCVIRLRFTCDDYSCCICKSELKIIFITKALGDYTKVINDFSAFAADPVEGQVGPYWYHEATRSYFDDLDYYKMIKAMCRLSCIVCDKKDEKRNAGSKGRVEFKNIEQLKSHLFNQHRLLMCILCLEGRKVFMCEQKLFTRAQLDQHIKTGDSEVDGTESERGGFMGHPMCEFCRNPFYGETELYMHMSTEHYTCHICQRRHPGQYEYYRNYEDMEIHFRQEHHLCEDEACLAKKFVVFATESELKRHNTVEHGGRMSRSKRNAALQIPISFQYRRSHDQDHRIRGCGSHPNSSDDQLLLAMQATRSDQELINSEVASVAGPFDALAALDSEPSSRYCEAVGNSRNVPLEDSYFPPLPGASKSSQRKLRNGSEGSSRNSMAARLRHQNNGTFPVSYWPATSLQPNMSAATGSRQSKPSTKVSHISTNSSSSYPARITESLPSSSHVSSAQGTCFGLTANFASSFKSSVGTSKVSSSASAPNLVGRGSIDNSLSNFPPVCSAQVLKKAPPSIQRPPKGEDVQSANKALVEKIRVSLESDEDKFSAFKGISAEYRQGIINTKEYLAYVHQFGLSHLVLEIARLCPDVQKQRELLEIYNFNMSSSCSRKNGLSNQLRNKKSSKKGKEKYEDNGISDQLKVLQLNQKPSMEEAEVYLKGERQTAKGKSKVLADEEANSYFRCLSQMELSSSNGSQPAVEDPKKKSACEGVGNKPRKKVPKFLRNRLGDDSAAELSYANDCDPDPDHDQIEEKTDKDKDGLPARGVWLNGGGQKLLAKTRREGRK